MKRAIRSFAVVVCASWPAMGQAAEPVSPTLRLPDTVRPLRQAVTLRLDPSRETFSGEVDIDVELKAATSLVWLNATELTVREARAAVAGATATARVVPGSEGFAGLAFDAPVGPGSASLHLAYDGKVNRTAAEGVFAQKEGADWYAFTQFEAIAARKAFPCFDEPAHKIPWRIALRVPKDLTALSNAPMSSTRDEEDGTKTVAFAETKPMPSYLVAVAAGPFDVVDAGTVGKGATRVRIVVPRGRAHDTRWAVESTPRILALLEDYFDRPYPYEKLDQVAIPIPMTFAAMEHPGLVTYGQTYMVQGPEEETITTRRDYASLCAHELAHMWFGNLVTMSWWDDVWLNEAFASWVGQKITDRFHPDWNLDVTRVIDRSGALLSDSLATARAIRQPITSEHDIRNAFDGITYGKGEAVIEMFESWLGEEVFRQGVQAHLTRHAWGNATAADFIRALSTASGRDVKAAFSTFLDQAGAPLVTAEVRCDGPPRAILTQKPYRPLGARATDKTWQIPVCLKHGAATGARECTLLAQPTGQIALGSSCPEWTLPNAGMAGYYRVGMTRAAMERALQGDRLSLAERVGLLGDVQALVASGDVATADALAIAASVARDMSRHVVVASRNIVASVGAHVPDELRPRYTAFVSGLYGARARELGWKARTGEDEDTRLLRETLVLTAGWDDAELGKDAVAIAGRWLDDPGTVDADLVDAVLLVAARHGDRPLFDRFAAEVRKSANRDRRERLFRALGFFREPTLARAAQELALAEGLDLREAIGINRSASFQRETRRLAFEFVKANFDTFLERLPRDFVAFFPYVGASFCEPRERDDLVAFFKPRIEALPGGPRNLDQVVEGIDLCIAQRKVVGPSLSAFLLKR